MIPLLLALAAGGDPSIDVAVAHYRQVTQAERGCVSDPDSADITICGRRQADRFRVSFVGRQEGDETDNVPFEREAMLHRTNPVQDLSPFLVGGGMAGVTVSTRSGVSGYKARELAP